MWLKFLRLALPEHAEEGKADDQPAQPDASPFPACKNPTSPVTEDTSEILTPKQQITEMMEKVITPGEHASDRTSNMC
jgi:hypothetical protein